MNDLERTAREHGEGIGGETTVEATSHRAGKTIAGRYKLLQLVGEGGMGSVWLAEQFEPVKRRVAVKLIRLERGASSALLARFEAERQAIALMDHPHIARLLDAGATDEGLPFFAMEFVQGVPLTDYCDERRLSIPERLELFRQLCGAVQHAHQKGIIHRDLKPTNILVESHDGEALPKIIDFGLAKATSGLKLTEQTLFTGFGAMIGTPMYMAPEQASTGALDIDTRADIYALGVILYELLTGVTPITRETLKQAQLDELFRLIREEEPARPSTRLSQSRRATSATVKTPHQADSIEQIASRRKTEAAKLGRLLRGDLDWIVMKAISKDRERRYDSAGAFAKEIERFLRNEPVLAGPPSAGYRLKKFARRHRGKVVAAGLVLAALLLGVAGTTTGMFRAEAARRIAANAAFAERRAKLEADRQRIAAEKSAADEMRAKQQAEKRLAQIEKGVELFASMLRGLSPRADGDGPPLYEQLRHRAQRAADELSGEAVADPLAEARLQTILGNLLRELGDQDRGASLLETALATRKAQLGEAHADTIETMNFLAMAHLSTHAYAASIPLLERVGEWRREHLGEKDPLTLVAVNNLASALQFLDRVDEAIPLLEEVCAALAESFAQGNPTLITARGNLAGVYVKAGRIDEGIELFEALRQPTLDTFGPDNPSTFMLYSNLSRAYLADGRLAESIELNQIASEGFERKLGVTHPSTLTSHQQLATAYFQNSQYPEAIGLWEKIRDAQIERYGADDLRTLTTLKNLGVAYEKNGQAEPALALYLQAAEGVAKAGYREGEAKLIVDQAIAALERANRSSESEAWRRKWNENQARSEDNNKAATAANTDESTQQVERTPP